MGFFKDDAQSWKSFSIELVVLLSIVLFIRFFIFQFFQVSGPSMCPTLNFLNNACKNDKGEFIFVNEAVYNFVRDPKRGEIVVFKAPYAAKGRDIYIKRVIGVAGDTINVKDGKVYLTNDKVTNFPLPESYLSPRNQGQTRSATEEFKVPEGHILVFGDNRDHSSDARQCFSRGCFAERSPYIEISKVKGKAVFVIWPFWQTSNEHSGTRFLKNELDQILDKA